MTVFNLLGNFIIGRYHILFGSIRRLAVPGLPTELSTSYSSPSVKCGCVAPRYTKSAAVGFSDRGDSNWCNSPLFLAIPIISCLAKSFQFATGPSNLSSPSAISSKVVICKRVVSSFSSSSGLKGLKKMVL